jgi:hypothetical protein
MCSTWLPAVFAGAGEQLGLPEAEATAWACPSQYVLKGRVSYRFADHDEVFEVDKRRLDVERRVWPPFGSRGPEADG